MPTTAWNLPHSRSGQNSAQIILLGAFATQGAKYIRVEDAHIAEARKYWLAGDPQLDGRISG